jgi:hypothetical protein
MATVAATATVTRNYGTGSAGDHNHRQQYKGRLPKNTLYNLLYTINGLKPLVLFSCGLLIAVFTLLMIAVLYLFGGCYSHIPFTDLVLVTFLQIMGTSTDTKMTVQENNNNHGYCGLVQSATALLQIGFKSILFAVMVNKLTKITPKLYFTPEAVINFRDGTPVIMVRILNAQGSILELIQIQAQWVTPHTTIEGEHHGRLHDLQMTAFHRLRSPITLSHVIDKNSPMHDGGGGGGSGGGVDIERLTGKLFITAVFWDPANKQEVRHSARYNLKTQCKYNHRFADLTTTLANGSFAADVNLFGVTLPLDDMADTKDNGPAHRAQNGAGGRDNAASSSSKYTYSSTVNVNDNTINNNNKKGKTAIVSDSTTEDDSSGVPWYIPDWNLPEHAATLQHGTITLLVGARFYQNRLIPRCDFSAFVEMCMIECNIPYRRYLLNLDDKITYTKHFPPEIVEKNIPFLHNGEQNGGQNGEWHSLSNACTNAALNTLANDDDESFVKSFRLHNPLLPTYDHKTFSDAVMLYLMAERSSEEEKVAGIAVHAFLNPYEIYLEQSGSMFFGSSGTISITDCQFIPHVSACAALWCRVKRTSMLEHLNLPRLREWHKRLIQRKSFRQTWPQGYSLKGTIHVVAEMALDKAQVMYGFQFPDLINTRSISSSSVVNGGDNNSSRVKGGGGVRIQKQSSGDISAFCL